jgi:hypothetical protein
MIEIKDLLARFERIILSEESKREAVRLAISEAIKVPINPDAVEIKGDTIFLNIKPIYKNEIFLKQEQVQKKLQEIFLGKKIPMNIR